MRRPNQCPVCQILIEFPKDRQFASIACDSCSTTLWVITRQDGPYLFDSNDLELFQHFAGKFRAEDQARYAANGWVQVASKNQSSLFDQLVEHRKFSTQKLPAIEVPESAIVLDFSDLPCRFPNRTEDQIAIEGKIRQLAIASFVDCSASDLCFAIDVNHDQYTFIPTDVDWSKSDCWPIPFTPFSEYLAFNTRCFSQGIFVDPRLRRLFAYGESFQKRFEEEFSNWLGA